MNAASCKERRKLGGNTSLPFSSSNRSCSPVNIVFPGYLHPIFAKQKSYSAWVLLPFLSLITHNNPLSSTFQHFAPKIDQKKSFLRYGPRVGLRKLRQSEGSADKNASSASCFSHPEPIPARLINLSRLGIGELEYAAIMCSGFQLMIKAHWNLVPNFDRL